MKSTMSDVVLSLVVLAALNFVGMFGAACTGFGENITFQVGWYLMDLAHISSGSLAESTAILTIVSIPLFVYQTSKVWHLANVGLSIVLAVTSAAGMLGPYWEFPY